MNFSFKKQSGTNEIPAIDLLRGIASVMVCYFHLARGNPRFLSGTSLIKQSASWGWSGVEIFFIISGFVIPYSMFVKKYQLKDIGIFLKKRLIRIEPPYLVSIVLVLILNYLSTLLTSYRGLPFTINWPDVLSHIAYLNIFTHQNWLQDVYWTLAIEFQYYLLISLAFAMVVSPVFYYRLFFFVLFICLMQAGFVGHDFIFGYTGYFMVGILLFQVYCGIIQTKEFFILLLTALAALYWYQGPVLTGVTIATVITITTVKNVWPVFKFLGLISYSLYLVHIPIGGRVINFAESHASIVWQREVMVFVAFVICIAVAYLFYLVIEKRFKKIAGALRYSSR